MTRLQGPKKKKPCKVYVCSWFKWLLLGYFLLHGYAALSVIQTEESTQRHRSMDAELTTYDSKGSILKQYKPGLILNSVTREISVAANPANTASRYDATIIVQLKGEMCNNLQKFAFGFGLQLWAKQRHNIAANIVPRHMPRKGKWVTARDDLHQCFPNMRNYDFEQGNYPEFKKRRSEQLDWLQNFKPSNAIVDALVVSPANNVQIDVIQLMQQTIQGGNSTEIECGLAILNELAHEATKPKVSEPRANITVPNVWIGNRPMNNVFLDKYYSDYRGIFAFDEDACCAQRPEPDESVFHFRQFSTELQKLSIQEQADRGYSELTPYQTAHDLFGHLQSGDKLAMTTRFHNALSQSYVTAFEERGIQVRVITNQTGVQDFCFLKLAQKELVGIAKSTFVRWAGILGSSPIVRLYSIKVAGTNGSVASSLHKYPWQSPELKSRLQFEEYDHSTSSESTVN